MIITYYPQFFFWGKYLQLGKKKRASEPNKRIYEICEKQNAIFSPKNYKSLNLDNMFLQVVKTRKDSKKNLLVHQYSRHLLLINVEDPS